MSDSSGSDDEQPQAPPPAAAAGGRRSVARHVRERQRAVAEREATRLARPAKGPKKVLAHADKRKAAVTSTPFGILPTKGSSSGGGIQEEESSSWCGPLAIARQMIAAREQKRRQEQLEAEMEESPQHPLDEVMQQMEEERKRKEHPSLQWKPTAAATSPTAASTTSWYTKRQRVSQQARVRVPSLLDLCLNFLVQNFEHVESLGAIGPDIRNQIAAALVAKHKLQGDALRALAHVGMESLELPDASGITSDDLSQLLTELLPAGLQYLSLDQCGRCFGNQVVQVMLEHSQALVALSIGGAYLWKDADAAQVILQSRRLSSVDLKACPLVGKETIQALVSAPRVAVPLVELALEDMTLNEETWQVLSSAMEKREAPLAQLERLKLSRMGGLTDDVVTSLLARTTKLQALDLSDNYDLTDASLDAIRMYTNQSLRSLNLSGLVQLSADALEALFTSVEGAVAPPRLKVLELANLDHQVLTDDVLQAALIAAADVRESGADGSKTSSSKKYTTGGGLIRLNVQGARELTDTSLEHLVTFSKSSLEDVNVNYCTGLTDQGMGYLIDQCGTQLRQVELYGLAQLTDAFLEGHKRSTDPTLVMTGIWMKKSSSRTIQ